LGIPFRNLEYVDFILEKLLKKNTQMTREEFKETLEFYDYSYKEEGGKILVIGGETKANRNIWLSNCVRLPSGVEFINEGNVWLDSLVSIPSGVVFSNSGIVHLRALVNKTFHSWDGIIEGINPTLLLNKMVALGLFDR
jgi:hypothetical protein